MVMMTMMVVMISITTRVVIIIMLLIITILIMTLKLPVRYVFDLFTALRTVSNSYTQVAKTQACANHAQHIGL